MENHHDAYLDTTSAEGTMVQETAVESRHRVTQMGVPRQRMKSIAVDCETSLPSGHVQMMLMPWNQQMSFVPLQDQHQVTVVAKIASKAVCHGYWQRMMLGVEVGMVIHIVRKLGDSGSGQVKLME